MAEFRPCIVVPTYNNARTLARVLDELARLGLPVICIDDGATDATAGIIGAHAASNPEPGFRSGRHAVNRGKAAALLTGFGLARGAGLTHAVTFDSDGQMSAGDVPRLVELSRANPRAFVLGFRRTDIPGYPAKNRLGRWLSNAAIAVECGRWVRDSQCGLRVYPLDLPERARCRAGRFGFEAEVITRAAWLGYPFVQVPIACRYELEEGRVTHYSVRKDTVRGLKLHARLLVRAPWAWVGSLTR